MRAVLIAFCQRFDSDGLYASPYLLAWSLMSCCALNAWLVGMSHGAKEGVQSVFSLVIAVGEAVCLLAFLMLAIAISWYDVRHRIIAPQLLVGLVVVWLLSVVLTALQQGVSCTLLYAARGVVGFAGVAVCLLLAAFAYERLRGRDSFGGGDIKLLSVFALYLGFKGAIVCLLAACALMLIFVAGKALACALVARLAASSGDCQAASPIRDATFPFAPALCFAAFVLLAVG